MDSLDDFSKSDVIEVRTAANIIKHFLQHLNNGNVSLNQYVICVLDVTCPEKACEYLVDVELKQKVRRELKIMRDIALAIYD
jgi:galactose-1-phosphate uridylyltransferase